MSILGLKFKYINYLLYSYYEEELMEEDEKTLTKKIKSVELQILRDTNNTDLNFHIYELSELKKALEQLKDKS